MREFLNSIQDYLLFEEAMSSSNGLPMDLESRMKRANQLGFKLAAFHATRHTFDAFRTTDFYNRESLGIHVGTVEQAHSIIKASRMEKKYQGGDYSLSSQMMPLLIRGSKWLRLPDFGAQHTWNTAAILHYLATEHEDIYNQITVKDKFNPTLFDIRTSLERIGFDGIVYKNEFEGDKSTDSYIVFDPKNIRSIFAVFDPEKSESADLIA